MRGDEEMERLFDFGLRSFRNWESFEKQDN